MREQMNRDEMRQFALGEKNLHDPEKQFEDNPKNSFPDRCMLCSYTRHPCSTFELAEAVLYLLDEGRTDQ